MEYTQSNQGARGVPANGGHFGVPVSGQPIPQGAVQGAILDVYGPEDIHCPRVTRKGNPCKNVLTANQEVCWQHTRKAKNDDS